MIGHVRCRPRCQDRRGHNKEKIEGDESSKEHRASREDCLPPHNVPPLSEISDFLVNPSLRFGAVSLLQLDKQFPPSRR